MSLNLSLFCLEHASFVLSTASIYVSFCLSNWGMPLSEPKYLSVGSKKTVRWDRYGSCLKNKKWGGFLGVLIGEPVECSSFIWK